MKDQTAAINIVLIYGTSRNGFFTTGKTYQTEIIEMSPVPIQISRLKGTKINKPPAPVNKEKIDRIHKPLLFALTQFNQTDGLLSPEELIKR